MDNRPLFILEMANNHMGDLAHGRALIAAMQAAVHGFDDFQFAFKLQYRDLDTFIHSSAKGRADIKYVKRFEETRLSHAQYLELVTAIHAHGFISLCTPFDEPSVDLIEAHSVEMVKIASASFTDWPLLERIALVDKPVIASTAGASLDEIDAVVSFLVHRGKALTLMHCVAEYPTPDADLRLSQIDVLRTRYPNVRIGFSTHEDPADSVPVMMAVAKGATVFEKHVALEVGAYKANAYSATPDQVRTWLTAARRAFAMSGPAERLEPFPEEGASLRSLRRGVFAVRPVAAGQSLRRDDVEFAFPPVEGQLTANEWSKYAHYTTRVAIAAGEPVLQMAIDTSNDRSLVLNAVRAVKALLTQGNIIVPGRAHLEISHHYGMAKFPETGLSMITVVNREYAKKLLVMLPGQTHPEQYHHRKEETFVILHGTMRLWLDGEARDVAPGDVVTVSREMRHKFHTDTGVVFEEISSTHFVDDSFYTDSAIAANTQRKTILAFWM